MTLAINESVTITVKASKKLGGHPLIVVTKGQEYRFDVHTDQKWYDMGIPSGPAGYKNYLLLIWSKRVPSAKCFTLCGSIGKDEKNHFPIGKGLKNYTCKVDGTLYFFANDNKYFYWNNWGSIKVEVTRLR